MVGAKKLGLILNALDTRFVDREAPLLQMACNALTLSSFLRRVWVVMKRLVRFHAAVIVFQLISLLFNGR